MDMRSGSRNEYGTGPERDSTSCSNVRIDDYQRDQKTSFGMAAIFES